IGYQIQYKPYDYILNQERLSANFRNQRLEELQGMHYFNLKLFPVDGQDLLKSRSSTNVEYQQAIYYYSFHFQDQVFMIEGNDTLRCELFHFVRDHGLSPELNFVLGFPDLHSENDHQLVIDDEFFG